MKSNDFLKVAKAEQDDWLPDSWQSFEAAQQATYPDQAALQKALQRLAQLPPW